MRACAQVPGSSGTRKHGAGKPSGPGALGQVLVERELQRRPDHVLDGLRGEVEVAAAFLQRLGEALQVAGEVTGDPELGAADLGAALDLDVGGLPVGALAEHLLLDLGGDDVAGAAEVLADVSRSSSRRCRGSAARRRGRHGGSAWRRDRSQPCGDEVVDVHLGGGLAVTVDAAVALLQAIRVPGDLPVQQPVAVVLQVDALAGGVGREQDAQRVEVEVVLEDGFDVLAFVLVLAAVELGDAARPHSPRRSGARAASAGCRGTR